MSARGCQPSKLSGEVYVVTLYVSAHVECVLLTCHFTVSWFISVSHVLLFLLS